MALVAMFLHRLGKSSKRNSEANRQLTDRHLCMQAHTRSRNAGTLNMFTFLWLCLCLKSIKSKSFELKPWKVQGWCLNLVCKCRVSCISCMHASLDRVDSGLVKSSLLLVISWKDFQNISTVHECLMLFRGRKHPLIHLWSG